MQGVVSCPRGNRTRRRIDVDPTALSSLISGHAQKLEIQPSAAPARLAALRGGLMCCRSRARTCAARHSGSTRLLKAIMPYIDSRLLFRQAGAVPRAVSINISPDVASDHVLRVSSIVILLIVCQMRWWLMRKLLQSSGPRVAASETMEGYDAGPLARPLKPARIRPTAQRARSLPSAHSAIVAPPSRLVCTVSNQPAISMCWPRRRRGGLRRQTRVRKTPQQLASSRSGKSTRGSPHAVQLHMRDPHMR
jgi:hypothetical protein